MMGLQAFVPSLVRYRIIAVPACVLLLAYGMLDLAHPQGLGEVPVVIKGAFQGAPTTPGVFKGDLRALPQAKTWKRSDPMREVPRRLTRPPQSPKPQGVLPPPAQLWRDPLLALQESAVTSAQPRIFSPPTRNFDGIAFTGFFPPDSVGDVGPRHYIQMVNVQFAIYAKSGHLLVGPVAINSLWTGFGGECETENQGDPIVLYDHLADRWLLSQFAFRVDANDTPIPPFRICIAISRGPDPVTDGFFLYGFEMPEFPDYPKFGVWPDGYYMSTNESSPAVYAFDRQQMRNGQAATFQRFTVPALAGFGFQALIPSDLDGPTPPPMGSPNFFMRHRDDEAHGNPLNALPPNPFDLHNIPLRFQPHGAGGFDVDSFALPFDSDLGINVGLPDDGSIAQPLGFTFPFYGFNYSSVFVNSNGNLTFGVGDSAVDETVADFVNGPPRLAPFWDDLNPRAGGGVFFKTLTGPNRAIITWSNVPEFPNSGANTAQVTLFASGEITLRYNGVSLTDALVGISPGGGGNVLNELDFSDDVPQLGLQGPIFELFSPTAIPGPGDPRQDFLARIIH